MGDRLYALDWLRIGAFALLIFYHIGMFFVPWDWHIKARSTVDWAVPLMLLTSAWRLSLLFLISGVASAYLLAREQPARFAASRTKRLLFPLIAAMALFVPPQPWVELSFKHGYTGSYLHFWAHDYFSFGTRDGVDLPTWNHLWFVAYLWVYSLLLSAGAMVLTKTGPKLLRMGERALRGWRLVIVPLTSLALFRLILFPLFPETHGLTDDWYNHASYGLMFLIGALLAHSETLRADFIRWRQVGILIGVAGYIGYAWFVVTNPEGGPEPSAAILAFGRTARAVQAWGTILALIGFALSWRVEDSAARRYFTEAVFPYYIAHQTIIVLVAWWLLPLGQGNGTTFLILVVTTMIGCALSYELARRSGPLRPLFGLRANAPKGVANRNRLPHTDCK